MILRNWLSLLIESARCNRGHRNVRSSSNAFLQTPTLACQPELLEDRTLLSGVTVITHGFLLGSSAPGWAIEMGEAILDRADGGLTSRKTGSILVHNPDDGNWIVPTQNDWTNSDSQDDEVVLVYNWASESNDSEDGWLEAAADNLFASLMMVNQNFAVTNPDPADSLAGTRFLHAHSRYAGRYALCRSRQLLPW